MKIKDKFGNQIEIYQARNGAIQLLFGHNSVKLDKWQIEKLKIDSHLRDLENWSEENYKECYGSLAPNL